MRSTITVLLVATSLSFGCSTPTSKYQTSEYILKASDADDVVIRVSEGETVVIATTGQVNTHPNGYVRDADKWTNADGIPNCQYVRKVKELHGLPFMALVGQFGEDRFLIGKSFKRTFARAGELKLSVNDFVYGDNVGKFSITVNVMKPLEAR